jgi:hypothetical protein
MLTRRHVLRHLLALAGLAAAPVPLRAAPTPQPPLRLRIQTSPVAGFQYHHGPTLWAQLAEGVPLDLIREPANPHDPMAVRIDWQGYKLGYLPRRENHAVSQMLDRGETLHARITRLQSVADPWQRIALCIDWSAAPRAGEGRA